MLIKNVNLKDEFPNLENNVNLDVYCPLDLKELNDHRLRKTILIIPGGGYCWVSQREAEPIALRLLGLGYNAFVLYYSTNPLCQLGPIYEGFAAVAYIRKHAEELCVNPDSISVMGFSAGGHLAASMSCYFNEDKYSKYLNVPKEDIVINGCILGYPVITMDDYTHQITMENVTKNDESLKQYYSIEKNITNRFPKTFVWTTFDDESVNSLNSIELVKQLRLNNVLCEFHLYPHGHHGASLADSTVYPISLNQKELDDLKYFDNWFDHFLNFLEKYL